MSSQKRVIELLRKLIRIDSRNPGSNEREIAVFVNNYLAGLGLKSRIYEFAKGRSNVVARMGEKKGKSLLITPHLDTVPYGGKWHYPPFAARVQRNRVYGLGATDCKANLAVGLEAIRNLAKDKVKLGYNLIFAATADEECGSRLGLVPLLEKRIVRADFAVALDAEEFDVIITQKGLLQVKVKIYGKRAHGAYPWMGENAIETAVKVIRQIQCSIIRFPQNPYLRPPTVNLGTIKGGDKVNIVPDWCDFELDFRFLPGMSPRGLLAELKKRIKKCTHRFEVEITDLQQPYYLDEEHCLVGQLRRAMSRFAVKSFIRGSEGATVITFFQSQKIPAIATGFGSSGCAHAADEHADIANLQKGVQVLEYFLKNFKFA